MRRLVKRLFLFERPDLLSTEQREQWTNEFERMVCVEDDVPWLTIPAALREIEAMCADPLLDQTAIRQLGEILATRLSKYG